MNNEIKEKIKAYYIGNDIDKVLDYITDLQQENERLNNIIKNGINEELRKELDEILKCNQAQANRIYEAIEYVNTHKPSDTISFPLMKKDEENQVKSCFDYEFREIYQKELLDILQGSDKE